MHKLSCENEIFLHENEKSSNTLKPRFDTEARWNSEMAHSEDQAPAGQRYDPVDKYSGNQSLRYPVKGDLSVGWHYPPFEQLEPDQNSRA